MRRNSRILILCLLYLVLTQWCLLSANEEAKKVVPNFNKLTEQEKDHYDYEAWTFSPARAILTIKGDDIGNLDRFDLVSMGSISQSQAVIVIGYKDTTNRRLSTRIDIFLCESTKEIKNKLEAMLTNKTMAIPFGKIDGIGDVAFGTTLANIMFARANFAVQVSGRIDVFKIARMIDQKILAAPLLQVGQTAELKVESLSKDTRPEDDPPRIKRSKELFEYTKCKQESFDARSTIEIPVSLFKPVELYNYRRIDDFHHRLLLESPGKGVKNSLEVDIWIFPSIAQTENEFLEFIADGGEKLKEYKRKKGPGRIAFSDNETFACFLYANVVYASKGSGINHIKVANAVADLIYHAPALSKDVTPKVIIEQESYREAPELLNEEILSTSSNAIIHMTPPSWVENKNGLSLAARQIGDAAIEGTIALDETQQKNLNKHLDEVIASFGSSNSSEREEANFQIQRLWRLTVPKLIENIGNKNISISEAAVKNLILMRNEETIHKIIEKVNISTDPQTRQAGIFALGMMKQQRSCLIPNRTCLDESSSDELARTHIIPFLTKLKETEKDPSTQKIIQNALNYLEHPINSRAKPDKK